MSYEGYTEWLCAKGHHHISDAYGSRPETCDRCGEPMVWRHAVDQTNGIQEDENGIPYPDTTHWPLEQIGEELETVVRRIPVYKIPDSSDQGTEIPK